MNTDEELRLHYRSAVAQNVTTLLNIWWSPKFQHDVVGPRHRDLSTIEVRLLWKLGSLGPMRPSEMSAELGSGAPSVSKAIKRLDAAGLVSREPSPSDQRSHTVRLTAKGRQVAQDLYDAGDTMVADIVVDWDESDVAQLGALLARFTSESESYARRIHRADS